MKWTPLLRFLLFNLVLVANASTRAVASPYIEFGAATGMMKSADNFFKQTAGTLGSTGLGFVNAFSIYNRFTPGNTYFQIDVGLQNRLSLMTSPMGKSLAVDTPHLAVRLEFWRIFVGAGYAPFSYGSSDGVMGLKSNNNATSTFLETGLIWRVIPELQIAAAAALELAGPSGSNSTLSEFGLRFRFPLFPTDFGKKSGVQFDGFRYPFGVMRE